MEQWSRAWAVAALAVALGAGVAEADTFTLEPVVVVGVEAHPSQQLREVVDRAFNSSRSATSVDGSVIQNLNPVNPGDALRYTAPGLINQPFNGDRFGGGAKIRTFGDFGASQSIDGLPAFKTQGEEGGGYTNTLVPTIAIDRVTVLKGGRAVQYGDGTDGGVIETRIKSGRSYQDHQALSFDASSAREGQLQAEAADSGESWDYYAAGSGFYGHYDGDPEILDRQAIVGGVGKLGVNLDLDSRVEMLAIFDRNRPDIIRNGAVEEITSEAAVGSMTLDHRITDSNAVQAGMLLTGTRSQWPARSRDRSLANQILFADHHLSYQLMEGLRYDGSVGAELKRTKLHRDGQWDNTFQDYSLKSRNALTIDDNLVLTAGLRHTWFTNDIVFMDEEQPDNLADDGVLSYQAGASYSVLEGTRLRASHATGFNRFFEKYGNFGTDALNTLGAGDEIVESRTFELGVNQAWDQGYLDVAYYNIVQDNVPRRNAGAIESVEVEQSGLEVELYGRITDQLSVSAGYMWLIDLAATRADGTEVNSNIFWDGQAASVPEHQVSFRLSFPPTDDIGLWGAVYYTTGFEAVDAAGEVTRRDGFTRLDLGASWWATDRLALRFRVENVLDERDFGATVAGLPTDDEGKLGRVIWFGLDYTF